MKKRNSVFIATSLDGFIADKNGKIDWLNDIPNPDKSDLGFNKFITKIDAIIMGRKTFETVCGFDIDWPYKIPVFVLSNSLKQILKDYKDKAYLVKGSIKEIINKINEKGYYNLYIDGGTTVQSFLKEDVIDDLIITTIPIILGEGVPLFNVLNDKLDFELISSEVYINQLVQSHYRRKRA
ncbi:dihydrofolate reductase family protein [Aquimarina sediminis]|uniref:dihydrofolate reductase family protein n=1 Tax=Aquimarina sediminis TaxID=2070536 RepID=UPI000CA0061E|nr:dihydrofolate reductase [Aquimarina sediminis]